MLGSHGVALIPLTVSVAAHHNTTCFSWRLFVSVRIFPTRKTLVNAGRENVRFLVGWSLHRGPIREPYAYVQASNGPAGCTARATARMCVSCKSCRSTLIVITTRWYSVVYLLFPLRTYPARCRLWSRRVQRSAVVTTIMNTASRLPHARVDLKVFTAFGG